MHICTVKRFIVLYYFQVTICGCAQQATARGIYPKLQEQGYYITLMLLMRISLPVGIYFLQLVLPQTVAELDLVLD